MLLAIPFPNIDPVLVSFGPFAVRWYALAYIAGLVLGWRLMRSIAQKPPFDIDAEAIDDFLVWAIIGVILGGRIGYVLFYNLPYYADHPLKALQIWQGGMSFHGGFLGVVIAGLIFCRRRGIEPLKLGDLMSCAAPIGLFFGRIANFINGELFGRVTDVPWGVVFPHGGPEPRHPSQLYEAALEGIVLFAVLWFVWHKTSLKNRPGAVIGVFLAGYGVSRIFVEFFREPDAHLGFIMAGITMGQILSLPMALAGLFLIYWAKPLPPTEPARPVGQKKSKKRKA